MELISADEKESVLRKYFIRDAKLSLASALMKRLFVSESLGVPWSDVRFARKGDPVHGKPGHVFEDGTFSPIDFNVSHQAGLVALVGTSSPNTDVGVDVVCVNERNDYRVIDKDGLGAWVDIYKELFSENELDDMKFASDQLDLPDGTTVTKEQLGQHVRCCKRGITISVDVASGQQKSFGSDLLVESKLRRFYTYWCYKEAYIKLAGEGLLADWIPKLEFRNVRAPKPESKMKTSSHGKWGEIVSDAEIWFRQKRLDNVSLSIQAFEEDYMISVATRPLLPPERKFHFKILDVEKDILPLATPVNS